MALLALGSMSFAEMMRAYRLRLGLTQEELAEAAGLSPRGIVKLEVGQTRAPRPATVRMLADAFGLTGADRDRFHQAATGRPAGGYTSARAGPSPPAQLPPDLAAFAGRAGPLSRLDALVAGAAHHPPAGVVCTVSGTAGVGKTALVRHWAHRVADRFPDGQLYLNLRGFDPGLPPMEPADTVRGLLDALQVPPSRIPPGFEAQVDLYRRTLAERRMLVVLDNARDAAHVRPVLPGAPGCLVVVTSRNQLTSLVTIEGAHPITLDPLGREESHQFLERRLGVARIAAEPGATQEIITRCAGLPLALAIVATRAAIRPDAAIRDLVGELRHGSTNVDALGEPDPAIDLRAAFGISYQTLTSGAARLFRLLGTQPGPDVSTCATASLSGGDVASVRPLLAELTQAHMINEDPPGRYTFHDLLREYAVERARTHRAGDDLPATRRLLDFYLHTAHAAAMLRSPYRVPVELDPPQPGVVPEPLADRAAALAWFNREHRTLRAAQSWAASAGFHTHTWQLAWAVTDFLFRQGHWRELESIHTAALESARRLDDPVAEACARRGLARACVVLGSEDDEKHLQHALELLMYAGDRTNAARTHLDLAVVLALRGRRREAIAHDRRALRLSLAAHDLAGQAYARNGLGWNYAHLGRYHEAIAHCQAALALHRRLDDKVNESEAWDSLGYASLCRGTHQRAVVCYRHAWELAQQYGDRRQEAAVLIHLGEAHRAAGEPGAAHETWQRALLTLRELDDPLAEQVRDKLDQVRP